MKRRVSPTRLSFFFFLREAPESGLFFGRPPTLLVAMAGWESRGLLQLGTHSQCHCVSRSLYSFGDAEFSPSEFESCVLWMHWAYGTDCSEGRLIPARLGRLSRIGQTFSLKAIILKASLCVAAFNIIFEFMQLIHSSFLRSRAVCITMTN